MLEVIERILAAVMILALVSLLIFIAANPLTTPPEDIRKTISLWEYIQESSKAAAANWLYILIVSLMVYFLGTLLAVLSHLLSTGSTYSVPGWLSLRALRENDVFKLSYVALVLIPIIVYPIKFNLLGLQIFTGIEIPLNVKLTYFSAFFFAIATIVFSVACPRELKNNIAAQQAHTSINHDRLFWRWVCWVTFGYGVCFLLAVLLRSARFMFYA